MALNNRRNLKGLRLPIPSTQPFQGCFFHRGCVFPGLPKAEPWAEISERFQRYSVNTTRGVRQDLLYASELRFEK